MSKFQRMQPRSRVVDATEAYCTRCGEKCPTTDIKVVNNQDLCSKCRDDMQPRSDSVTSAALEGSKAGNYYADEREAPMMFEQEKEAGIIPPFVPFKDREQ